MSGAPNEQPRELLTVIVPCLNEAGNVEQVVADVLEQAPSIPMELQILLVDDGSTDGTPDIMHQLAAAHPNVRVRINPSNMGVGRTVMGAYAEIPDHSWVTVIPGDNEFYFSSIHHFLPHAADHDVIVGYVQNPVIRTFSRRMASFGFLKTVSTLYGFRFRYLNGMKLYKVSVFKGIEVVSGGHAYNAELMAKAVLRDPNLRMTEASFVVRGRSLGNSKAIRPESVVRALKEVYQGFQSVSEYREVMTKPGGREA